MSSLKLFWKKQSKLIEWNTQPSIILTRDKNNRSKWYEDGKLNVYENCIGNKLNTNNKNTYSCSGYGYQVPQPLLKQDCNLDNCTINSTGNNKGIGLY